MSDIYFIVMWEHYSSELPNYVNRKRIKHELQKEKRNFKLKLKICIYIKKRVIKLIILLIECQKLCKKAIIIFFYLIAY